ncbi:MAG: zinc ribbon domain-containing protein, partial [Dehalococcoidia bacterium]|nr:zinc ribbon domain-containing protein [Dehalococcoidia bacterium]
MIYVVAAIVAAAAFGLVAYPLFQRRELELAPEAVDLDLEDLHSRREAVYGAINELDFEYQLGNLSDADYQSLRNQYRQRAASVLKGIDELTEAPPVRRGRTARRDLDAEIEEAVRRLRAGGSKSPTQHAEPGGLCSNCGAHVAANDRFCSGCGTDLAKAVGKSCPECGAGLEPGDK